MSNARKSVGEMTVKDVMRPEVLAVEAGWSMDQLADFLVDKSISGAPVTSADGQLIGVVLTRVAEMTCATIEVNWPALLSST